MVVHATWNDAKVKLHQIILIELGTSVFTGDAPVRINGLKLTFKKNRYPDMGNIHECANGVWGKISKFAENFPYLWKLS